MDIIQFVKTILNTKIATMFFLVYTCNTQVCFIAAFKKAAPD